MYVYMYSNVSFFLQRFFTCAVIFQVFASTPAWFCGTGQAALGGARGLGHLAVSDFAIDEVATLLWRRTIQGGNRRRDFSSRTIQLLMGKSVGNYMEHFFQLFFGCF